MNKAIYILLFLYTVFNTYAKSFKIEGKIDGLMPGDTLYFEKISFPGYKRTAAFKVIVKEPNKFTYKGKQDHINLYSMTYRPIKGKEPISDRWGISILIEDGTTILKGNVNQIYYANIKGGLYTNDLLQQAIQHEMFLGKGLGELYKLENEADLANDRVKKQMYKNQIYEYDSIHDEEYKKISKLYQEFYKKYPSSPHTIIELLQRINNISYKTLLLKYEQLDEKAKNSVYGIILKQEIDKIATLQPGQMAPDFNLKTVDGKTITLSDFKDTYVLIYHWGLCGGSFQLESSVTKLYEKYKDKLTIIGITDNLEKINQTYHKTNSDEKLFEVDRKETLKSMLSHPWLETEKIEENLKVVSDYNLDSAGYPYFVFISPDGKIIRKGYHDAFHDFKKILDTEFSEF
jgi:hypothetical protein